MRLKIYLAGPDVFLPDALEVGRAKQALCRDFGFEGLFPLDQGTDVAGDPERIFHGNCRMMAAAYCGLANLSPFRGPGADGGTAFEVGYMHALGRPVFGYAGVAADYAARTAAAFGPLRCDESGLRDRDGLLVEDFGLFDNLMLPSAIEASGGELVVQAGGDGPALAAMAAFRACLERLAARLTRGDARPDRP